MPHCREPNLVLDWAGVTLEVFRAKWSGAAWPSDDLSDVIRTGRERFRTCYGEKAPVFDVYDEKAAIYAVRASYDAPDLGEQVTEWLSLRLVPAQGLPSLTEDLLYYHSRSRSMGVDALLHERGLGASPALENRLASIGRIGVVRPRTATGVELSTNRCVAIASLAALRQFVMDAQTTGWGLDALTVQMSDPFAARCRDLPMVHCDVACGLARGDVVLNRRAPHLRDLCYQFPAYFLEPKSVARCLAELIEGGMLDPGLLARLLPEGRSSEQFLANPTFQDLRGMGTLFGTGGTPSGCALSGERLRRHADERIEDAPSLRLVFPDALSRVLRELDVAQRLVRKRGYFELPRRLDGASTERISARTIGAPHESTLLGRPTTEHELQRRTTP